MKKRKERVSRAEQTERDHLLRYINNAKVTTDDMIRVMDEIEERDKQGTVHIGEAMFVVAIMFRKQPQKAQSIIFRCKALADLLSAKAIPGYYAMPKKKDGAIPIREAVLVAAASEPLISIKKQLVFDRESFVKRCLKETDEHSKEIQ